MSIKKHAKRTVLRCVLKAVSDEQDFPVLAHHSIDSFGAVFWKVGSQQWNNVF